MSEFDIHRRENPRIILLLWITLAAALVLFFGLAWQQLIAEETFDQIEKRQIERRILKRAPEEISTTAKDDSLLAIVHTIPQLSTSTIFGLSSVENSLKYATEPTLN